MKAVFLKSSTSVKSYRFLGNANKMYRLSLRLAKRSERKLNLERTQMTSKPRWVNRSKKKTTSATELPSVSITVLKEIRTKFDDFLDDLKQKDVPEERIEFIRQLGNLANFSVFSIKEALILELEKLANVVKNAKGT